MYTAYQPTSLGHTIVGLIFYILMAVFIIYSLLSLYALMRFGRNRILTALVALFYLIISAGLYAAAVNNLTSIKY